MRRYFFLFELRKGRDGVRGGGLKYRVLQKKLMIIV